MKATRSNGSEGFGYLLTSSRLASKRKDRERECAREIVAAIDQLPVERGEAWCLLPPSNFATFGEAADLEKVTAAVRQRFPKITLELPEPAVYLPVTAMPFSGTDRAHGLDPELGILDRFDTGFGETLKEARRVNGMVRKQWYIAVVWAKPDQADGTRPFMLGIGMATERSVSRVRALYAAEARAQILTEAMFSTKAVPQKQIPEKPLVAAPPSTPAIADAPAAGAAAPVAALAAAAAIPLRQHTLQTMAMHFSSFSPPSLSLGLALRCSSGFTSTNQSCCDQVRSL